MSIKTKLDKFWEMRKDFEPLISRRRIWDLKSFTRDKRQVGLIFPIKERTVLEKLNKINQKLSGFDSYNPFPHEHFHITIKILGTLDNADEEPDDYKIAEIDDIIMKLNTGLSWFKRFKINICRINLFPSVVFAEIHDNGRFSELNGHICDIPNIQTLPDRDLENFIPHIAIGNFKNSDTDELIKTLEKFRNTDFGTVYVDSLDLVKVDLTQTVPAFETLEKIKLGK